MNGVVGRIAARTFQEKGEEALTPDWIGVVARQYLKVDENGKRPMQPLPYDTCFAVAGDEFEYI